jgi:hypothetical protein
MKEFFKKYNKSIRFVIVNTIVLLIGLLLLHRASFIDISIILPIRYYWLIILYLVSFFVLSYYQGCDKEKKERIEKGIGYFLVFLSILFFLKGLDFQISPNTVLGVPFDPFTPYINHLLVIVVSLLFLTGEEERKFPVNNQINKRSSEYKKLGLVKPLKKRYRTFIESIKKDKWYLLVLLVIIGLGIFLRVRGVFLKSPWFDEGISMDVARRVAEGYGHTRLGGSFYPRVPLFHSYLSLFQKAFGSLYGYGVLANIPFFIITSLTTYLITKTLSNRKIALFATFLFSFSWYPIAEFRNIRFYEAFLCFFMVSVYFLFLALKNYYRSEISNTQIFSRKYIMMLWKFLKRNIFYIIFFLLFFYISFETLLISAFLVPSVAIAALLISIFTKKRGFLLIFLLSTLVWVIAVCDRYNTGLSLTHILYQPEISWLAGFGRKEILQTYKFFLSNNYWYFLYSLILTIPITFFSRKKFRSLAPAGLLIGYYIFVAIQGTGTLALRYYYPTIPLVLILTAINLFLLLNTVQIKLPKKIFKITVCLLVSGITIVTVQSAIVESISIYTKTSKIKTNNMAYREFFEMMLEHDITTDTHFIGGDNHTSYMYYIHNNKTPSYVLSRNSSRVDYESKYQTMRYVGYLDLIDIIKKKEEKEVIFMFDNQWNRHPEALVIILGTKHEIIFEHKGMLLIRYK